MKCIECKNFKARKETIKRDGAENNGGTCTINNSVCDPGDECKTGLFDKLGPI